MDAFMLWFRLNVEQQSIDNVKTNFMHVPILELPPFLSCLLSLWLSLSFVLQFFFIHTYLSALSHLAKMPSLWLSPILLINLYVQYRWAQLTTLFVWRSVFPCIYEHEHERNKMSRNFFHLCEMMSRLWKIEPSMKCMYVVCIFQQMENEMRCSLSDRRQRLPFDRCYAKIAKNSFKIP